MLVIGAGAIGAYLGASLGRCGQWVTLVGRKPFVDAVNQDGIRMHLPDGHTWQTTNFRAVGSLAEANSAQGMYGPPYDAIFICVKAYDMETVIRELKACDPPIYRTDGDGTCFVCFQNGVGSEERLAQAFGAEQVWAGTTTSPVTVPQAGQVQVARAGGTVCLAPLAKANKAGLLMAARVKEAFWSRRVYPDARALKWSKLLLNMMGNATSAILGMPPGELYAQPAVYQLELQALREATRVMRRLRIQPVNLPHYPAATLASAIRWLPASILQPVLRRRIVQGRGSKWPSFYYDVQNGTGHCEVAWLNGAIAAQGRALGLPTPANQRLADVLMRIVSGVEDAGAWRGQCAKLTALTE
jgi:2-dehydropantoate 2-reductase